MRKKTRLALIGAAFALAGSAVSIPFAGPAGASSGASVTVVNQEGSFLADGALATLTGSGFPSHSADPTGLQIIECSDPGGSPSNLPTDPSLGCDGSTVSSNQINTSSTGTMSTTYPITSLSQPSSNITCDPTHFCVLWVGVDYNGDFSDSATQAFSAPFEVESGVAPSFTTPNFGGMPTFMASSVTVRAAGVDAPAISESGALPSGVTYHDNGNGTATFTGKPASTNTYPITLTASNGFAPNASQSFTLYTGFHVTTKTLPAATVGVSYSSGPIGVTGGTAPYKYKVKGLPKGLKGSKTNGAITGTATSKNHSTSYTVTVTVTDTKIKGSTKHPNPSAHGKETATATLHLTLNP